MKTSWLGQRKDFFVSNLVQDFFAAKKYFDEMLEHYKNNGSLPYSMLAVWVGSDTDKGPLWQLKEHSHRLYRSNRSKTILFENLFDWVVGSIFHESMKLKEDIYQIESYKPLLEMGLNDNTENREIAKIIQEYYALIARASRSLDEEIESIDDLFTKGLINLRSLIVFYKSNALLLRFLIDNKQTTEAMFGQGSLQQILQEMFPAGVHEAYILASESCMQNGWYDQARKHIETAIKTGAANKVLRENLTAKLGLIAEKE
jgi:hypothetical protein